jgi:hypothetical protein
MAPFRAASVLSVDSTFEDEEYAPSTPQATSTPKAKPPTNIPPSVESQHPSTRSRKPTAETGSFGRSVRRSRSKAGTPARKEDPNLAVAESIFSSYITTLAKKAPTSPEAPARGLPTSVSQPNLHAQALTQRERERERERDTELEPQPRQRRPSHIHNTPTEVILRGFHSTQQYAAISHFEVLAGRILEDYPRDAPISQRKFKSDLRDATALRPRALTEEERRKAMAFAGGENWIKVTFESEEAADVAVEESPQEIGGFLVWAERYRGAAPTNLEAVPAKGYRERERERRGSARERATMGAAGGRRGLEREQARRPSSTLPRSYTAPSLSSVGLYESPSPESERTLDTATISDTPSDVTLTPGPDREDSVYCRRIPTAKKLQLLPASDALLPQQSAWQKFLTSIPIIGWITGDIIGSAVPRKEDGEFDWAMASFYWKLMWWLDFWLRVFGGDIAGNGKDE